MYWKTTSLQADTSSTSWNDEQSYLVCDDSETGVFLWYKMDFDNKARTKLCFKSVGPAMTFYPMHGIFINLHSPNLFLHLQGQALEYLPSQRLCLVPFSTGGRGPAGCYEGGLSKLCHKCITYVW
jgi:hypothetical protein